jgi:imidazolonepropionase-like amidohydrolase
MAHAHGAEGIALAAQLGVRSVEHASFIDHVGIDACLQFGTWIVPTFAIGEYFQMEGSASGAQDRMIQLQQEHNARYYSCIKIAVAAGVKVAFGSDFVGWDYPFTTREFLYMHELGGLTPMGSIYAGTGSAADLLGIAKIGRIQPGNRADIVVAIGNPLDDLRIFENQLIFVMKDGKIIRDDAKVASTVPLLPHKIHYHDRGTSYPEK